MKGDGSPVPIKNDVFDNVDCQAPWEMAAEALNGSGMLEFRVLYEVPPMRGIFETMIKAANLEDAERKIRENPDTSNYRIKGLEVKP